MIPVRFFVYIRHVRMHISSFLSSFLTLPLLSFPSLVLFQVQVLNNVFHVFPSSPSLALCCFYVAGGIMFSGGLSIPFLWTRYPRIALKEFQEGWISKNLVVKGQGNCDLTKMFLAVSEWVSEWVSRKALHLHLQMPGEHKLPPRKAPTFVTLQYIRYMNPCVHSNQVHTHKLL